MIINANSIHIPLADKSVNCIVTSPPYWGLRDYSVNGQLGLEKQPDCMAWARKEEPCGECYICKMRLIARELWRVLRDDGVFWLNMGDSYIGGKGKSGQAWSTAHTDRETLQKSHHQISGFGEIRPADGKIEGLKPKDLCGIPWRLALALQSDGWYFRSEIISKDEIGSPVVVWEKPNPMPESVNGWRWERHRIKISSNDRGKEPQRIGSYSERPQQDHNGKDFKSSAKYIDCPGCDQCNPNDGYVLRKGSWRPTKSHEYVFMLTKSQNYFCDAEAVREPNHPDGRKVTIAIGRENSNQHRNGERWPNPAGRNLRSVWTIGLGSTPFSHFATFPEELVIPCILSSTSEKGHCRACGAARVRILSSHIEYLNKIDRGNYDTNTGWAKTGWKRGRKHNNTLNWRPSCNCADNEPVPGIVLDPFCGSGTTGKVAVHHGRKFIGLDLSLDYLRDFALPRAEKQTAQSAIEVLPLFNQE